MVCVPARVSEGASASLFSTALWISGISLLRAFPDEAQAEIRDLPVLQFIEAMVSFGD
jgi:hypothetical protein